jgi:integrase
MVMAGADTFAIMKAMGHADIKTTMIYVSLGRSHIREQVEKLNVIRLVPSSVPRMRALLTACSSGGRSTE